jgi:hypothetical protein
MKTWREIEEQLKSESHRDEFPAGLHDRVLRAVRDDRAAASIESRSHRFAAAWLLTGVAAAFVIAAAVIFQRPPPHASQIASVPAVSGFSFASLEAIATAPMDTEVANLETDIASAAKFLADCLPGDQSGT